MNHCKSRFITVFAVVSVLMLAKPGFVTGDIDGGGTGIYMREVNGVWIAEPKMTFSSGSGSGGGGVIWQGRPGGNRPRQPKPDPAAEAKWHLAEAKKLTRQGEYEKAMNSAWLSLQNKWESGEAHFAMATAMDKHFSRLEASGTPHLTVFWRRQLIPYYRNALKYGIKGRGIEQRLAELETEVAEIDRKRAERLDQLYPEQAANREVNEAIDLIHAGKLDDADSLLRKALLRDPLNAYAHLNLGYVLAERGKLAEAIDAYRRGVELMPNHLVGQQNLARLLLKTDRYAEVIDAARQVIRIAPGHAEGYETLAIALLYLKRVEEAEVALRKAILLDPDDAVNFNNLGVALEAQERFPEAAEAYQRSLALDPNRPKTRDAVARTQKRAETDRELTQAVDDVLSELADEFLDDPSAFDRSTIDTSPPLFSRGSRGSAPVDLSNLDPRKTATVDPRKLKKLRGKPGDGQTPILLREREAAGTEPIRAADPLACEVRTILVLDALEDGVTWEESVAVLERGYYHMGERSSAYEMAVSYLEGMESYNKLCIEPNRTKPKEAPVSWYLLDGLRDYTKTVWPGEQNPNADNGPQPHHWDAWKRARTAVFAHALIEGNGQWEGTLTALEKRVKADPHNMAARNALLYFRGYYGFHLTFSKDGQ